MPASTIPQCITRTGRSQTSRVLGSAMAPLRGASMQGSVAYRPRVAVTSRAARCPRGSEPNESGPGTSRSSAFSDSDSSKHGLRMIKTEHLSKRYNGLTAVDDVSFVVRPGEVLGFLGPNGAGKTTTMRMLAGFVRPTSGKASICGHDVDAETLKAIAITGSLPVAA